MRGIYLGLIALLVLLVLGSIYFYFNLSENTVSNLSLPFFDDSQQTASRAPSEVSELLKKYSYFSPSVTITLELKGAVKQTKPDFVIIGRNNKEVHFSENTFNENAVIINKGASSQQQIRSTGLGILKPGDIVTVQANVDLKTNILSPTIIFLEK